MKNYSQIDDHIQDHFDNNITELSKLCSYPTVSAKNQALSGCADYLKKMLEERGFTVQLFSSGGPPVIFAERQGKSDNTLLFYNHYDVQPAEPLELWDSPPFEPEIRNGKLYARGTSDNKGNITSRIFAIDALLSKYGELPCNIKFIIEGEEETSSVHLHDFVRDHQNILQADACIWEFGGVDHRDVPMQYLGLRGICYVELSVETANIDVHSGIGGSIFPNAAWRLVWALNSLKDSDERIRIPGHYDDVIPPSQLDKELMAALPDVAQDYKERYGVEKFLKSLTGGTELRLAEVFEPTCTICGLTSGYQGPGSKTVLPAKASAKVDFRLVPNQTPKKVLEGVKTHLNSEGFSDIVVTYLGGEAPGRTDPDDPFVKLVVETAQPIYDHPMQIVPMVGGSGPNHIVSQYLNIPIVSAGIGYPGSKAHAPNENIRLDLYIKATKHMTRIIESFGNT